MAPTNAQTIVFGDCNYTFASVLVCFYIFVILFTF